MCDKNSNMICLACDVYESLKTVISACENYEYINIQISLEQILKQQSILIDELSLD